jgi:hypothetical protein
MALARRTHLERKALLINRFRMEDAQRKLLSVMAA